MATIKDIANRLGVSVSTVSKGLNGASDISEELRQIVLDTAVEMGYSTKRSKKEENRKLCIFIENMSYQSIDEFGYGEKELYDELFGIICEVVCVKRKSIRVAGEDYPYELVKSRFLKLNSSHLEYVIGCMKETTTKITNIKAYMITTLYNAPTTINHFYQQEVQHDMYGGGWHEKGII